MDGWNTRFLLGNAYFQGQAVSFREVNPKTNSWREETFAIHKPSLSEWSMFLSEFFASCDSTTWNLTVRPWKMAVGRLLSYWEGNFSGAMLNFGRVTNKNFRIGLSIAPCKERYRNEKVDGFSTCENRYLWSCEIKVTLNPKSLWMSGFFFMDLWGNPTPAVSTWFTWKKQNELVGFFSPFEQWESSPRGENQRYLKPPPRKGISFWEAENFRYLQVKKTLFNFMSFFPTKSCTQSIRNSY